MSVAKTIGSDIAVSGEAGSSAAAVLKAMMEDRRSPATQRAYRADVAKFFAFRGRETTPESLAELCALRTGALAIALNEYKSDLRDAGLSPATINRRLAAARSLLRLARKFGLTEIDPHGLVDNEKSKRYRDTRGPSVEEVRAIMATPDRTTLTGRRDYALLRLLWDHALRRAEICACNIEDYDPRRRRLSIVRKGGAESISITLTKTTVAAIDAYLEARTGGARLDNGEPLFANLAHRFTATATVEARRLHGGGIYWILRLYGAAVLERRLTPHMMRHASATGYLDASDGDIRGAQALTGHVDPRTLQIYDDNRKDNQGAASELVSKLVK